MSSCSNTRHSGIATAIAVLLFIAGLAGAGEGPAQATVDQAVQKGLAALLRMQAADGSFGDAAPTALAGMALLAGGHTPTRGAFHDQSARCLRALMAKQDRRNGYLGDGGQMYAHGFATLYLAESYGMAPDENVRRALEAATDLIQSAQNQEGGWRYQPNPTDADISVTICQVMALRAAWNAGIGTDTTVAAIRKAITYVRGCANADGSFNYIRSGGGWGTEGAEGIPRASAGAMSLIGSGVTDPKDATLGPALAFIRRNYPGHLKGQGNYFWYGQYYCAQAMFHSPDPTDWDGYWRQAAPAIMRQQGADGRWTQGESTAAYATAMALIILQVPNQYLPIFQR
jgi:hypothetical protein